jgi:hypothetical protein
MLDYTSYFDVIIREKFKQKAEIDEQMINQIKKRFEGLINLNDDSEGKRKICSFEGVLLI